MSFSELARSFCTRRSPALRGAPFLQKMARVAGQRPIVSASVFSARASVGLTG